MAVRRLSYLYNYSIPIIGAGMCIHSKGICNRSWHKVFLDMALTPLLKSYGYQSHELFKY
jgi:hypothetical protein